MPGSLILLCLLAGGAGGKPVTRPADDPFPGPSRTVARSAVSQDCEAARALLGGRYSQRPPGEDATHGWPWQSAALAPPMIDADKAVVERAISEGCFAADGSKHPPPGGSPATPKGESTGAAR